MTGPPAPGSRVLVAIPAYNEAATVERVVRSVRAAVPRFDLLVVNDGSTDLTNQALARTGVRVATHLCNLGYGSALQTAITYAQRCGYEAVITFDADGQHRAEELTPLYNAFAQGSYDLLIGSRFLEDREYRSAPLARRIGMRLFSALIAMVTGRSIRDTSSGLKVIGRRAFDVLTTRPVVDFHAEAIVYLIRAGFSVSEFPVTVDSRVHGESMYHALSALTYPLKVLFLIVVSALDARRDPERGRA
jgi:glycosyltransferase involved in cell wall biosynthesis